MYNKNKQYIETNKMITTKEINHAKMNEIYKNENIHVKESKIIIQQEESLSKSR